MLLLSHLSRCSIFTHSGLLRREQLWSIVIDIIHDDVHVGVGLSVGKAAWNDSRAQPGVPTHTSCPLCASHMMSIF